MRLRVQTSRDITGFTNALACSYISIFRASNLLDDLIRDRNVQCVSTYCAMNADKSRALLTEMGIDPATVNIKPVVWYPVAAGYASFSAIRAGLDGLDVHPDFMSALCQEIEMLHGVFAALSEDETATFYFDVGELHEDD